MPTTPTEHVEEILSDDQGLVLTLDNGDALLVDWYDWSSKPESFIEVKVGGTWVRVECDTQSVTCSQGRDLTTEPVEAGTATITLNNASGRYTDWQGDLPPINEASEVRVVVRHPSHVGLGQQTVWWGWVSEWEQEWTRTSDTVTITAVDAISWLSEQGGLGLGWTSGGLGDSVPERLEHLIARITMGWTVLYAEPGDVSLVNPKLENAEVIDELHRVALSDGGRFFTECDNDGTRFVYLDRSRFQRPPIDIDGAVILDVSKTTELQVDPDRVRPVYRPRLAQQYVPLFSDLCAPGQDSNALPFTDLEWSYRGWERPSLVAVSNIEDEQRVDPDGNALPTRWDQHGALAGARGRRHNLVEFTELEFRTKREADELAYTYAEALSRASIDVTTLEVHPELDDRLWDVVTSLRQGDWVYIERHLQTDRLQFTAAIEGIRWDMTPTAAGGQPRWKVTYKLSALVADVTPITPDERPPRPPTVDVQPPLPDVLPLLTLSAFGSGSSLVVRGTPPYHFTLEVTDPAHTTPLQAYAHNPEFGTVQLPILAPGSYVGDVITVQCGGVDLPPGTWVVWVRDAANPGRLSNQQPTSLEPSVLFTLDSLTWVPAGMSTINYTDDAYPAHKPRLYARGPGGEVQLTVATWQPVGNADTTTKYRLTFNAAPLGPGDWEFRLWDRYDSTRRTGETFAHKATDVPGGLRLAAFNPSEADLDAWRSFSVQWSPVKNATGYRVYYTQSTDSPIRERTKRETATFASFDIPRATASSGQQSVDYKVQVSAIVNGQEGPRSPAVVFNSGYPYIIRKDDYSVSTAPVPITTRNQVMGVAVPQLTKPPWAQNTNPNADHFVGIVITELEFKNLKAQTLYPNLVNIKLNHYGDGRSNVRLITKGTAGAHAPGGSPPVTGSGSLISGNPHTPWSGTFGTMQVGHGFIGLRLEGTGWGIGGPTQPALGQGAWCRADSVTARGDAYHYLPPRKPRVV